MMMMLAATAVAGRVHAQVALGGASGPYHLSVTTYRDLPFRRVLRQQYDNSGGSAALATLLRYHFGRDVAEGQVFRAMYSAGDQQKIRRVGFSLLDMKAYLAGRGMRSNGYRVDFDRLATIQAPSITIIKVGGYRHFVVIKGVQPGGVLVGDPATGLKVYSRADFEKAWNPIIFLIDEPSGAQPLFNRPEEWRTRAGAPVAVALSGPEMDLVADLRPLFELTRLEAP